MPIGLTELLSAYGLNISDLDDCAIQYVGGDLDDPLEYISVTISGISKNDRERLGEIVKQRAQQIRTFLGNNPLWEKGGLQPLKQ